MVLCLAKTIRTPVFSGRASQEITASWSHHACAEAASLLRAGSRAPHHRPTVVRNSAPLVGVPAKNSILIARIEFAHVRL